VAGHDRAVPGIAPLGGAGQGVADHSTGAERRIEGKTELGQGGAVRGPAKRCSPQHRPFLGERKWQRQSVRPQGAQHPNGRV
jgi:hypothetical protein